MSRWAVSVTLCAAIGLLMRLLFVLPPDTGKVPAPRPSAAAQTLPSQRLNAREPVLHRSLPPRLLQSARLTIPAGATVILGSLDQTAGSHQLFLSWQPGEIPTGGPVNEPATDGLENNGGGTNDRLVRLRWHDVLSAPEQRAAIRDDAADPQKGQAPAPGTTSERDGSLTVRRFRPPYFSGHSTFERFTEARVAAVGQRVRVFTEGARAELADADDTKTIQFAEAVVEAAESGVLQYVEARLGPVTDADADGWLSILLCHMSEDWQPEPDQEPIAGCVRGADFEFAAGPFGGDIVYLDSRLQGRQQLRAVLAHEFSHAAVFSAIRRRGSASRPQTAMPSWLNEAIAHVVELEVCPGSPNLQQRIEDFRRRSNAFPVVIPDQSDQLSTRRGAARAAACSFLATTVSSHCNGQLHSLLTCPAPAANALESVTGVAFSELFRSWTVQLLRSDLPAARYHMAETAVIPLVGTSFVRLPPETTAGRLTVQFAPEVQLQVTIVEGYTEVANTRLVRKTQ